MLRFYGLTVVALLGIILPSNPYRAADTLKFAWPDGASATVHVRSVGKRVSTNKTDTWDMALDYKMHLKRTNGLIVVSRSDFSGWKGTLPPSFGGGAERFVDMVPTVIVSEAGAVVRIEGHETARKLMAQSVEQSGGLHPLERNVFETMSSNASLEAMAKDQWSTLVRIWKDVELEPGVTYEMNTVTPVPQLGGGEIEIKGIVKFVKEAPCESPRNDRGCVHFYAETEADKTQLRKILQSLLESAAKDSPAITGWDRQLKVDAVVDKLTMLPQHLKITRIHKLTLTHKLPVREESAAEEYSTTYTFTWLHSASDGKKADN
jgi:hypothetical protein